LKQDFDVLVIGGGAIGLCCAHYLNRAGRKVALVEKGEVGSGASRGNAGLIIPSQCIPLAAPGVITSGLLWMLDPESPFYIRPRLDPGLFQWLWKFARHCTAGHVRRAVPVLRELQKASLALFKKMAAVEGIDAGLRQNGMVEAYRDRRELEKGIQTARLLRGHGLENRTLDGEEVAGLFGGMRTRTAGGVFYPADAHLVPGRFIHSLARHIEGSGAVILRDTEVIGMQRADRRITAVQTTRGDFAAREVVLAGGSWSPQIACDLGLRLFVQPAKGYSISFKRPAGFPEIPLVLTEAKVAVTPMDDTLRFAGTLELAGWDLTISRRRVEAILNSIPAYLPDVDPRTLELIEIWRGLRPCTPDGLPSIGRPKDFDNLIVATGHGMKGISMAPVTGKLVAQLADCVQPDIDLAALRVERFKSKRVRGLDS
jgi:D-amino-acid dehydrogenase